MLLLVIPDMPLNCHNCFQWNRPYSCEALDYDRKQLHKLNVHCVQEKNQWHLFFLDTVYVGTMFIDKFFGCSCGSQ